MTSLYANKQWLEKMQYNRKQIKRVRDLNSSQGMVKIFPFLN